MTLSIIIVSYNTKDITRNCLSSIIKSELTIPYEIIIVDNNSHDGSQKMIDQEFPEVTLICNSENQMFAKANNQGIRIAKGEYILLLNSDTLVEENNIEKLVHFMDLNPNVGCTGPKVLNKDGSLQSAGHSFQTLRFALSTMFFLRFWPIPLKLKKILLPDGAYLKNYLEIKKKVGWVSGCCMLLNKKALMKVGLLDENLYFYSEEVEWCYRLKKNGLECWIIPESNIVHLWGASTSKESTINIEKNFIRQRVYVLKRTVGIKTGILVEVIMIVHFTTMLIFSTKEKRKYIHSKINERIQVIKESLLIIFGNNKSQLI